MSGRHLVLLPGFMCDADLWADMAGDLAKLGSVHYGNVYQDDSLDGMARRVLSESPEQFVLVGFSMGGFVARVLTLMAPERVAGVAFVCTSARGFSDDERRAGDAFEIGVTVASHQGRLSRPDRRAEPALHAAQAVEQGGIALAVGMEACGDAVGAWRAITGLPTPLAPLGFLIGVAAR